jgi:hypothetical protein
MVAAGRDQRADEGNLMRGLWDNEKPLSPALLRSALAMVGVFLALSAAVMLIIAVASVAAGNYAAAAMQAAEAWAAVAWVALPCAVLAWAAVAWVAVAWAAA